MIFKKDREEGHLAKQQTTKLSDNNNSTPQILWRKLQLPSSHQTCHPRPRRNTRRAALPALGRRPLSLPGVVPEKTGAELDTSSLPRSNDAPPPLCGRGQSGTLGFHPTEQEEKGICAPLYWHQRGQMGNRKSHHRPMLTTHILPPCCQCRLHGKQDQDVCPAASQVGSAEGEWAVSNPVSAQQ